MTNHFINLSALNKISKQEKIVFIVFIQQNIPEINSEPYSQALSNNINFRFK